MSWAYKALRNHSLTKTYKKTFEERLRAIVEEGQAAAAKVESRHFTKLTERVERLELAGEDPEGHLSPAEEDGQIIEDHYLLDNGPLQLYYYRDLLHAQVCPVLFFHEADRPESLRDALEQIRLTAR